MEGCVSPVYEQPELVRHPGLLVRALLRHLGGKVQVAKSPEPALEDDILLLTGAGSVEVLPASGPES